MGLLYLHGQASWNESVCLSSKKMKGKVHMFLMFFLHLLPQDCFSLFQDFENSFSWENMLCIFLGPAVSQGLQSRTVEDMPMFSSAIFWFCRACSYPHIFISLCYRYWQAPLLRAGLSFFSSLGSTLGTWARIGHELQGLLGRRSGRAVQQASRLESEGPHTGYQSLPPVCSFCFLLGCTLCLPTGPLGIALLLPQLQSVHISLN